MAQKLQREDLIKQLEDENEDLKNQIDNILDN